MLIPDMRRKLIPLLDRFYAGPLWSAWDPTRFLKWFAGAFLFIMMLWSLVVVTVDPYIYWHRAVGFHQVYSNTYAMIPGILRKFDYDTVLVGSSLSKNFRISDINATLGVNAVKATAAGANGEDWVCFMREALATGKVKRFIICADPWVFNRGPVPGYSLRYRHLYGARNVFAYLYSLDTVEAVGDVLKNHFTQSARKRDFDRDFDRVFFDPVHRYHYGRSEIEEMVTRHYIAPPRAKTQPEPYFEKFIFSIAKEYPGIRFDLFLAPCSIYMWCGIAEQGDLEAYLVVRRALAERCDRIKNVFLHDLQAEEPIVCNLENYRDITHYSPEINHWILAQIAARPGGNTAAEVSAANERLRNMTEKHMAGFTALREGPASPAPGAGFPPPPPLQLPPPPPPGPMPEPMPGPGERMGR